MCLSTVNEQNFELYVQQKTINNCKIEDRTQMILARILFSIQHMANGTKNKH